MKKLLSLALSVITLFSVLSLVGCGQKLKFGVGSYAYTENVKDADADNFGSVNTSVTVAAVLLDNGGKIIDCAIDCVGINAKFNDKGEINDLGELKSKYELGDAYGMKENSDAKAEWYSEVDSFVGLIKGKTLTDVKALVATDNKGNSQVIDAGCTIEIADFVKAVEDAFNNSDETGAKKNNDVKIAMYSSKDKTKNAGDDTDGQIAVDVNFAANTLDKNGKVTDAFADCLELRAKVDNNGKTTATNGKISSKKEMGDAYGMAQNGQDLNGDGVVKEWYTQAEIFQNAVIGKKSSEIEKLVGNDGYADDSLQKAGCTINISDLAKAAVKAAKK